MIKVIQGVAGAVVLFGCFTQVQAAERFYLGAGFGHSNIDSGVSSVTGTASLDETDSGFLLFGGYQFNRYFSLEGHYADFGEATLTGNTGDTFVLDGTTYAFTSNNVSVTAEPTSTGLGAVMRYPITDSVEPYLKLGIHAWDVDGAVTSSAGNATTSDSGTDAFYGIGVNVSLNTSLSVRIEAERFNFDNDDLDFISVGLQYSF